MKIIESNKIDGLRTIQTVVFHDFRGEYVETYSLEKYCFQKADGSQLNFVEDDISVSKQHVLRGLHGDKNTWKLVQCLFGAFYLVVVDLRPNSPTYLKWESLTLNDRNRLQVLVPAGCANGHLCLSKQCIFSYKQSEYYSGGAHQFTLRWDHPKINIWWPISTPLLSMRDREAELMPL